MLQTAVGQGLAQGCRFSDLTLDLNVSGNFQVAILISGNDCTVDHCNITTSVTPGSGWTVHAVLTGIVQQCSITDNTIDKAQIKLCNGGGGPIVVARNHISNSYAMGISCVTAHAGEVIKDILISDNIIELPQGCGIYAGNDINTDPRGSITGLVVRGNIINFAGTTAGIYARLGQVNADWHIQSNTVYNFSSAQPNTFGIAIAAPSTGNPPISRLVVSDNHVSNVDQAGIGVLCAADAFSITGNHVTGKVLGDGSMNTRGIQVSGAGSGSIIGNTSSSSRHGILVESSGPVVVQGNICKNSRVGGSGDSQGILVQADTGYTCAVHMIGNRCFDDQATKTQQYGIRELLNGGTIVSYYALNDLSGNAISAFGALNANAVVQLIKGVACGGSVSMGNGQLAVNVAHNLPRTPSPRDIHVTLSSSPGVSPGAIWVSGCTSTQFTVNVLNATTGFTFDWHASLSPSFSP